MNAVSASGKLNEVSAKGLLDEVLTACCFSHRAKMPITIIAQITPFTNTIYIKYLKNCEISGCAF
jgi:hypothetical protein